ncbi:MAG: gluconeogenesis factor YvcK family protein [Thermodesulfobacteriota bacterium]|nr:gluconeogenesis factor YvcK family protein [Thermodesulfobacteriota bacterium]
MDDPVSELLKNLASMRLEPFDLLPRRNLEEKLVELVLSGPPAGPLHVNAGMTELAGVLSKVNTRDLNVVVFGGGTGLSNLIGGDSRKPDWPDNPFSGLKEIFPKTRSIVCVTDDGGSTGELLKDLPLVAVGDIRHVLLSSIRKEKLKQQYGINGDMAHVTAHVLHSLFNYRFSIRPASADDLVKSVQIDLNALPEVMRMEIVRLLEELFIDIRLAVLLHRPHCLGNLLLASSVYHYVDKELEVGPDELTKGIEYLANLIGAVPSAVLPCTTTPAQLRIMYANGVIITGESKSAFARRGTAVDRVFVEFASDPNVPAETLKSITNADIIVFAPGSLYSSIIPILQVPGIADAVRKNRHALKFLTANLWVQKGETDLVRGDPKRRFYVSDLLLAYHRNIPGGVSGLFQLIMLMGFQDIPGSILQRYAIEGKVPIYLDRGKVWEMGFIPVEARIFSQTSLNKQEVIQHDPEALAKAIRTIWAVKSQIPGKVTGIFPSAYAMKGTLIGIAGAPPNELYRAIVCRLSDICDDKDVCGAVADIIWRHRDISLRHLDYMNGVRLIEQEAWNRCQEWDNVFSFYDPEDGMIKVRQDVFLKPDRFEVAFLVALGQSLLGNYAASKKMAPVEDEGDTLGRIFQLILRDQDDRRCFFSPEELAGFLVLVRMVPSTTNELLYTRLINGREDFTPPGLLFGLMYAWYLDNRFADHIEYKMTITEMAITDLIPAQIKKLERRRAEIDFFRRVVFGHTSSLFGESAGGGMMNDE